MSTAITTTPSGVNEPGLPKSRSAFYLDLGSLPLAGTATALAGTGRGAVHPNDLRLASLANRLEALFAKTEAYVSALEDISDDPIWNDLINQYSPLEQEVTATDAMSFFGIMAKVRAVMVPSVHDCNTGEQIAVTIAEDLARLYMHNGQYV